MSLLRFFADPDLLFRQYGTFWRELVEDRDVVRALARTIALRIAQAEVTQDERRRLMSVKTAPPYRRLIWTPITIYESDVDSIENVITYGSGEVYGGGFTYGQRQDNAVAFRIDRELVQAQSIVNNLYDSTAVLFNELDYTLVGDRLVLARNPFDDPRFDKTPTINNGESDRSITLWAVNADIHDSSVFNRWGAVLGIPDGDESQYADAVAAAWRLTLKGASIDAFRDAIHAAAGVPSAAGNETVEVVDGLTQDNLIIVTDQNVYRLHKDATPVVSVGDHLVEGQELTDTIRVDSFVGGDIDLEDVPTVVITKDLGSVTGNIGFENKKVPLTKVTVDGVTDVEFELAGRDEVVEAFWDEVHARGIASGDTLADAIKRQYGTINIEVNPAEILVKHLLYGNTALVITKPEHFLAPRRLTARVSRSIARYLPPRTILLQYTFLSPTMDTYDAAPLSDEVVFFDGLDTIDTAKELSGATLASELGYTDLDPRLRNYPE